MGSVCVCVYDFISLKFYGLGACVCVWCALYGCAGICVWNSGVGVCVVWLIWVVWVYG